MTPHDNAEAHTMTGRFRGFIIGFALVVGLGFLLLLGMSQQVNAQANGAISGIIYESSGTTPVTTNARVDVYTTSRIFVASTQANPDGTYTVSVPAGNYFVSAVALGRAMDLYEGQGAGWGNSPTPVPVTVGNTTTGINFTLDPGGTISGIVRDSAGQPLTSTHVALADTWIGGACTDASGQYTLYNLSLDTPYKLRAGGTDNWCINGSKHNFQEWYWQSSTFEDATPVTLTSANPNQTGIDFSLNTGASISGTVFASDGVTPISGAWVTAVNAATNTETGITTANADGTYSLLLPAGQYRLHAAANGRALKFYSNTALQSAATPITAAAGTHTGGINFTLDPGGTISGAVTDSAGQPLANINVWVNDSWISTCTNANGQYTLPYVSLNIPYIVSAGGNNWCSGGSKYFVQEWWQESNTFDGATPVTLVTGSPNPTGINFTLAPGGTVSGTIRDSVTNQPLANFNVDVFVGLHSVSGVCTDSSGKYTLTVPINVPVRVATGYFDWCGGQTNYIPQYWQGATLWENATLITATPVVRDIAGINFALSQGGRIAGTVTAAEDSTPLDDVWVCTYAFEAATFDTSEAPRCAQTGADGTYIISGIAPGNKRVWIFPEDRLRLFYNSGSGSNTFEGASPVSVISGGTTTGVNFSLPLAGIISGTIYEADGITPLEGVTVSVGNGDYPECTQADGTYRLFVPAGTHVVRAAEGMCNGSVNFPTQHYDTQTDPDSATPVNVSAVGVTVSGINFTNQLEMADAPVGLRVSGNLTLPPVRPAFQWRHILQMGESNTPAEWYNLVLVKDDAVVLNDWFSTAQICPGLVCTALPDSAALPVGLLNGDYRWWVNAWGGDAFSEWSAEANFTVKVPAPALPSNLNIQPNQGRPSMTWANDLNAAWYQIYVGKADGTLIHLDWYEKAPGMCGGLTCTLTPFAHPTNGTYVYYIQAWGPGGFNDGNAVGWAGAPEITLDFDPPGLITPLTTTHVNTGQPTFSWLGTPGATWYGLWVGTTDLETAHYQWHAALDMGCDAPVTCTITPNLNLENGKTYMFYVQAWGPGGLSSWVEGGTFTVSASIPGSPVLTAPNRTISIANPAFVWESLPDAAWYEIEIDTVPMSGTKVHTQWYSAAALGCRDAYPCSLVADGVFLSNGNYAWRVRAYSPAGLGKWSDSVGFIVDK